MGLILLILRKVWFVHCREQTFIWERNLRIGFTRSIIGKVIRSPTIIECGIVKSFIPTNVVPAVPGVVQTQIVPTVSSVVQSQVVPGVVQS